MNNLLFGEAVLTLPGTTSRADRHCLTQPCYPIGVMYVEARVILYEVTDRPC